jgi:hypothetical protein
MKWVFSYCVVLLLTCLPSQTTGSTQTKVSSIGAPTAGALIEGMVGSRDKSSQPCFSYQSVKPGFVGPEIVSKPIKIRDQPGIFPAPALGPASISFAFYYSDSSPLYPVIVQPDGSVINGEKIDFSSHIVIPSPAQLGIYSLFILASEPCNSQPVIVKIFTSTRPSEVQTIHIKPITQDSPLDLMSAEFIYKER